MRTTSRRLVLPGLLLVSLVAGCSRAAAPGASGPSTRPQAPSATATSATTPVSPGASSPIAAQPEAPIAPEKNAPGDISDTQVFVVYRPPSAGFEFKVPEGWSRTSGAGRASFTDKLNIVTVTWASAGSAPTLASVGSAEVKQLGASLPAFRLVSVKGVKLTGGEAILVTYQQNGEPNPVTGKRYRLDVERFILFRGGSRADLVLSSPVGADNVDPWRIISESFKWL
jgi:hypothetical protein